MEFQISEVADMYSESEITGNGLLGASYKSALLNNCQAQIQSAQDALLQKLEHSGRVPSREKFRRMICMTYVSCGGCPYNDRCVFLHDPRIRIEGVRLKAHRQMKHHGNPKDAFYWPDMEKTNVTRVLDQNGLPDSNQPYSIPPTFTQATRHNRAIYSLWMHFIDNCVRFNAGRATSSANARVADRASASRRDVDNPEPQNSKELQSAAANSGNARNKFIPGMSRLPIFVDLSNREEGTLTLHGQSEVSGAGTQAQQQESGHTFTQTRSDFTDEKTSAPARRCPEVVSSGCKSRTDDHAAHSNDVKITAVSAPQLEKALRDSHGGVSHDPAQAAPLIWSTPVKAVRGYAEPPKAASEPSPYSIASGFSPRDYPDISPRQLYSVGHSDNGYHCHYNSGSANTQSSSLRGCYVVEPATPAAFGVPEDESYVMWSNDVSLDNDEDPPVGGACNSAAPHQPRPTRIVPQPTYDTWGFPSIVQYLQPACGGGEEDRSSLESWRGVRWQGCSDCWASGPFSGPTV